MPWDDELEGNARVIAAIDASPLRVIAGPGTGKTRALLRRIARLLEQGTDPRRILAVTFTRTAAADLVRQLGELNAPGAGQVRAGTLHSLCFSILARAEVFAATGRNPRPLLPYEQRFLIEDLTDAGFGTVSAIQGRLRAFEAAWARLQSDEPGWPPDEIDRRFQGALLSWLRFHRAILVGELVPETLRYLRNNPACPERAAFHHVLVDEYQDLNRAEQSLLDLLAERGNLVVIGDENQSIYSFKYAHPDGIATFNVSHAGTHDEALLECRRCPQLVVRLVNELIRQNHNGQRGDLRPRGEGPVGEVHVVQWPSLEQEAAGLARFVRSRVASGSVQPGRVLVLCPRRVIGYAVRDALRAIGVAAHSFFHEEALEGNPKNSDGCHAQRAFTILTYLANAEDRVALRCWLGFGSPSLRKGAYRSVLAHCERDGVEPRVVLEALVEDRLVLPRTGDVAEEYRELTGRVRRLEDVRGQGLVDALFPAGEAWTEPFRVLATGVEGEFGPSELREPLRVGITQPELPTNVDFVRVMSLHKSKGLTADLVIVADCIEGVIPYVDSDLTAAEQERMLREQRRLFYVALTRTTGLLVLSSVVALPRALAYSMRVPVRRGNRTHARTVASRFLAELGPELPIAMRGGDWLAATPGG